MFVTALFLFGLFLLVMGGSGVISNSLSLAGKLKISPLIIGIIFVGIGTSLPEIFVSLFSGLDGSGGLGLGNIVGSNIAHICLFLGSVLLFVKKVYIGSVKTQQNGLLMLLITIVFSLLLIFNVFRFVPGALFIFLGFGAVIWEIYEGKKGAVNEDRKVMANLSLINNGRKLSSVLFFFFISLIALIIGGKLVVDAGVKIAQMLGVSSFIIGATIVALGTSLPELTVTIESALRKNEDKLLIGNILGSNIYNILFCGGILGLFNVGGINNIQILSLLVISSMFFVGLALIYKGREIPRYWGIILLALYLLYLAFVFWGAVILD
jgi:cation:H+ antiporter